MNFLHYCLLTHEAGLPAVKHIRDEKYVSSFIREIYGDSNPFAGNLYP